MLKLESRDLLDNNKGKEMYKLFKTIIMIIGLSSTSCAANLIWAPIMMEDIITFVPYEDTFVAPLPVKTIQNTYNVDDTVSITVNTPLSGDKDWVGIFRVGDNNDWESKTYASRRV